MGGDMRGVKIAAIVMGVLILLGTAALIAGIAKQRMAASQPPSRARLANFSSTLDEPAGTEIVGATGAGDWVAIRLHGGGPDRVILIDPMTGSISGRIGLAR